MAVVDLQDGRALFEQHADVLDRPTHPGSVAKIFALMAAARAGEVDESTRIDCRGREVAGTRTLECAHPKFGRPLSAVEALAHSCNSFFAALAKRTTWPRIAAEWRSAGLTVSRAPGDEVLGAVGLEGPMVSPRALLDAFARTVAAAKRSGGTGDRILLDGLALAGREGTASAFGEQTVDVLAKTGSGRIYGGAPGGLVVAVHPAVAPRYGVVVIGAGIAGRDAAEIGAAAPRRCVPGLDGGNRGAEPNPARPTSSERVRLGVTEAARVRVLDMALEDYVAGVVAGESPSAAPAVVREALAVAARSYALANRDRHHAEGFDLCDLTHCQAYRVADRTSAAAAGATAGLVLARGGAVLPAFYSGSCGGHLEAPGVVWPGAASLDAAMPSRPDPVAHDPDIWVSEVSAPDLLRALRAAGARGDELTELTVSDQSRSGRIRRVRLGGLMPLAVSGEAFRLSVGRSLGWHVLKSSLFTVTRTARGYRFDGRGRGHGVGLCVVGASQMAERGRSRDDILATYFPGAAIEDRSSALQQDGNIRRRPTPVRPRVILPGMDEADRGSIEGLVSRALGDLEARIGVTSPLDLLIRFHPTVQSYVRAGGRGWWTGGVTRGHRIDLAPLESLRRHGLLEVTLRHELAHALTWDVVAGQRTWVREGLADYFAEPARVTTQPPSSCPGDEAFAAARTPGGLARLYEQARACVARALARSGADWRTAAWETRPPAWRPAAPKGTR